MIRAGIPSMGTGGALLLALLAAGLAWLGWAFSSGIFSLDEAIYLSGAHAMARGEGVTVQNGFARFGSQDLRLWFLVWGPQGLTPQYPVGAAVLGAPLIWLFGAKGLMALNLLAAAATLVATHALTRRLFASRAAAHLAVAILALAGFWLEYAPAHWPHSVSTLATTLALLALFPALARERAAWRPAALAGLALGAGLFFRLDGALLAPGLAAAAILCARRPAGVLAGGALGLAAPLALLALSNKLRFGGWNPLSYGSSGGGTDPTQYIALGAAMLAGLALLIALRRLSDARPERLRLPAPTLWGAAALALLGLVAAGLAAPSSPPGKLAVGAWALLVDASTLTDPRSSVQAQQNGTLLFWGLPKKALGQSLPWLAGLILLAGGARVLGPAWSAHRRNALVLLAVAALWILPFALRAWHGGMGANMRYFLPLLPAFAALAGWLLVRLGARTGRAALPLGLAAALAGLVASAAWWMEAAGPDKALLDQRLASWALAGVALLCLPALLAPRRATLLPALAAICAALGLSAFLGAKDVLAAQLRRAQTEARAQIVAELPGRWVLYGDPEGFFPAFADPDKLLALPGRLDETLDLAFVETTCAEGYSVLLPAGLAARYPSLAGRLQAPETLQALASDPLVVLTCAP